MNGSNSIVISRPASAMAMASRAVHGGEPAQPDAFGMTLAAALPPAPERPELRGFGRTGANGPTEDAGERERRRRPASVDLSALAVAELGSREDRSPSASVQQAQAVLREDQKATTRDRGGADARGAPQERPRAQQATRPAESRQPESQGIRQPTEAVRQAAPGKPRTGAASAPGAVRNAGPVRQADFRGMVDAHAQRGTDAQPAPRATSSGRNTGSFAVGSASRAQGTREGPARLAPPLPQSRPSPYRLESESMAGQVDKALGAALRQGGGSVTLRLEPEHLGELRVQLALEGGRVEALFHASSEQARRLLNDHLPALRSALEAQGLAVDRLGVQAMERPADDHGRATHDPGTGSAGERETGGAGERDGDASEYAGRNGWARGRDAPEPEAGRTGETAEPDRSEQGDPHADPGGALNLRLRLDTIA